MFFFARIKVGTGVTALTCRVHSRIDNTNLLVCSNSIARYLEMDASYYMEGGNRSHCTCGAGMEINADSASCTDCPVGTFSKL